MSLTGSFVFKVLLFSSVLSSHVAKSTPSLGVNRSRKYVEAKGGVGAREGGPQTDAEFNEFGNDVDDVILTIDDDDDVRADELTKDVIANKVKTKPGEYINCALFILQH